MIGNLGNLNYYLHWYCRRGSIAFKPRQFRIYSETQSIAFSFIVCQRREGERQESSVLARSYWNFRRLFLKNTFRCRVLWLLFADINIYKQKQKGFSFFFLLRLPGLRNILHKFYFSCFSLRNRALYLKQLRQWKCVFRPIPRAQRTRRKWIFTFPRNNDLL